MAVMTGIRAVAYVLAFALVAMGHGSEAIASPADRGFSPPANVPRVSGTPQFADALRPLDGIPGDIRIHAAVATLPDPVETRQARSFDMTLAAGIAGFQAHGYVLDGYELHWPRPDRNGDGDGDGDGDGGAKGDTDRSKSEVDAAGAQKKAEASPASSKNGGKSAHPYRERPGLLVFRRDNWRSGAESPSVEYFLVFVVGESPSYGVQPKAFQVAADCAVRLDGLTSAPKYDTSDCTKLKIEHARSTFDPLWPGFPTWLREAARRPMNGLDIIGPSFSGSMQSLLTATRNFCAAHHGCSRLDILMLSPATTAPSNHQIQSQIAPMRLEYMTLTVGLDGQIERLHKFLCTRVARKGQEKELRLLVLAEASTYGAEMLSAERLMQDGKCATGKLDIEVKLGQFPPSIASIRTEKARLSGPQKSQRRNLVPGANRLLEFNLDAMDEGSDRPPAFQPEVSSRSDELMLYRTLDAMRLYVKPDVVIIIATEIRDRLFLLNEVRDQLPNAMPVLFEMDYLLVHPDYRKATRGTVVVPTADPLVCMKYGRPSRMASCDQNTHYHPFPSDYAANAFRAVSILAERTDPGNESTSASAFASKAIERMRSVPAESARPGIYVATLAGFQGIDDAPKGRFSFAAAETRFMAQLPIYIALTAAAIFAMVVAAWLLDRPKSGRWVFSLARQMLNDWGVGPGRPAGRGIARVDQAGSLAPCRQDIWACLMLWLSIVAIVIALSQATATMRDDFPTCTSHCPDYRLAHGRDGYAMACLWLLYGCVAIVGLARIQLMDRRLHVILRLLAPDHARNAFRHWYGARWSWILPAFAFVVPIFLLWLWARGGLSVDPGEPWWIAIAVLTLGVVFFTHLVRQHRLQRRLSMQLLGVIEQVKGRMGRPWPTYRDSGEPPSTPFNLRLRRVLDFERLIDPSFSAWVRQTHAIMIGSPASRLYRGDFEAWQARLVCELKLIATTIRTTAWCTMLAPVSVLLAINVYPPVYETFLTGVCIAMLVAGFAMSVFVVLRMEGDPMFGAMFTRDGDTLTFGGGLRALWPKFVAMGLVLLPLVAPDMWRWLHGLLRSMNSLD